MSQSRRGSAIETLCNYAIGIVLANCVWLFIVIPMSKIYGWNFHHEGNLGHITYVNLIFTLVSIIRTFTMRRLFNFLLIKGILR